MRKLAQFLTPVETYDHKPYVINGEFQKGLVVNQTVIRWVTSDGLLVSVPIGFVHDLSSLPWFVGWWMKKLGKHQRAGSLHDFLYTERPGGMSYAYYDKEFLLAMKFDKVGYLKRYAMYAGVRLYSSVYHRLGYIP